MDTSNKNDKSEKKQGSGKKKKKPREKVRHAALKREYNLKSRYDLLDFDYLDKLSKKELDWLNKFSKEWIGASFDKDDNKNLHKGKQAKKECYDANNARNRCILTRAKATGTLIELENLVEKETKEQKKQDIESSVVEEIDEKMLEEHEADIAQIEQDLEQSDDFSNPYNESNED